MTGLKSHSAPRTDRGPQTCRKQRWAQRSGAAQGTRTASVQDSGPAPAPARRPCSLSAAGDGRDLVRLQFQLSGVEDFHTDI